MNLLTIQPEAQSVSFRLDSVAVQGPLLSEIELFGTTVHHQINAGDPDLSATLRRFAPTLIPGPLVTALSALPRSSTLGIHATTDLLAVLPWPEAIRSCGIRLESIVHVVHATASMNLRPASAVSIVAWPKLSQSKGIDRETRSSAEVLRGFGIEATLHIDPTFESWGDSVSGSKMDVLHIATPGVHVSDSTVSIPFVASTGKERPVIGLAGHQAELIPVSDVLAATSARPRLVLFNTAQGAYSACSRIAQHLGSACIGWTSFVDDEFAAAFAVFFYERLLHGVTIVDAVRQFSHRAIPDSDLAIPVPVVWLNSPEMAEWRPFSGRATPARQTSHPGTKSRRSTPRESEPPKSPPSPVPSSIRLELEPEPFINPALLVNGYPALRRLVVSTPQPVYAALRVSCDDGGRTSVFACTREFLGHQPIHVSEVHFPSLYELAEHSPRRRRISFVATLSSADGAILAEETRSAIWMARNEWLDQPETWAFIPAFIDPHSDGVTRVIEQAQRALRVLGGPQAAFSGGDTDSNVVRRQLHALYACLSDDPLRLRYLPPLAGPIYAEDRERSSGQFVRTHSQVVEQCRGTCHDLALLLAACAEHVRLSPLIVLVRGHTLFGIWKKPGGQQEFWNSRTSGSRSAGSRWIIDTHSDVLRLLNDQSIELLDITVLQTNSTFDDASRKGGQHFLLNQKWFDVAIDVTAARRDIQSL